MFPTSPKLASTRVVQETSEWLPASFEDFLIELAHLRQSSAPSESLLLYRGQRDRNWVLDSTFARSIKKMLFGLEAGGDALSKLIRESSDYHRVVTSLYLFKFGTLVNPSRELNTAEDERGIDPWFELCRRIQQYPEEDSATLCGTNFIDWSTSPDVALYFANEGRTGEGAVYILDASTTGKSHMTTSMLDILALMSARLSHGDAMGGPVLFSPPIQLAYLRAKNQQAVYFAQMDLRYELEHIWHALEKRTDQSVFMKLILPVDTNTGVEKYLHDRGIHHDFVYPDAAAQVG